MMHKHFIISRTDNIGDVVLTLPLATLLRKQFPNASISFLARDYVRAVIEHTSCIDHFISWDKLDQLPEKEAVEVLQKHQATDILHVFPRKKIAKLAHKAKIPQRIGTSKRYYHWFSCNQTINFSRAKSSLHESQLNVKLLEALGINTELSLQQLIAMNPLSVSDGRESVADYLHPEKINLIIHALSNGNGREWPIEKFIALINQLDHKKYHVLITGSKKDATVLKKALIPYCPNANDLTGKLSLNDLLIVIKHSDAIVANSTGPLHLAAALGIKTLGLFPRAPLMAVERWGALGENTQHLIASRSCDAKCQQHCCCMDSISVNEVKQVLEAWLLTTPTSALPLN